MTRGWQAVLQSAPVSEISGFHQNKMNCFAYQMGQAKWSVCCSSDFFFFSLLTTSAAGFSWLFAGHLAGETFRAPLTHCCVLLEEAQHLTCIINLFSKPTYSFSGSTWRRRSIPECTGVEVRQAPLERGCLKRSCCIHSDSAFHKTLLVCCFFFSPCNFNLIKKYLIAIFSSCN